MTRRIEKLDDLEQLVGQTLGTSEWMEIDQKRIDAFAEATGDHQWIHVDPERAARELPTGKTIAHGYLTLSLLPVLMSQIVRYEGVQMGVNYGSNRVRFTQMVPCGSRVRATSKLVAVDARGPGYQLTQDVTVEIENEERPALVAEVLTLLYPDQPPDAAGAAS